MSENAFVSGAGFPLWQHAARLEIRATPSAHHVTPLTRESVAEAICDLTSRRVLSACVEAARSVKEIGQATGIPLATAYRQVHRLVEQGILVVERSAMTTEGKKYDLYRSRIIEAHLDLTAGREDVRWIENSATEGRLIGLWDAVRSQARPPRS